MRYEVLVSNLGVPDVWGPIGDEFGPRWGPLRGEAREEALAHLRTILGYGPTMEYPTDHGRRFELHRDEDETGISGTGIVAEGMVCRDGVAMMRWLTPWPSSVCYYERGAEAIEALHGHGGKTRMVYLDE